MATSPTAGENDMVLALARSAQQWVGSRQPVNVLSQDQVHLFEPLGSSAPTGARICWVSFSARATCLGWTGPTDSRRMTALLSSKPRAKCAIGSYLNSRSGVVAVAYFG